MSAISPRHKDKLNMDTPATKTKRVKTLKRVLLVSREARLSQ